MTATLSDELRQSKDDTCPLSMVLETGRSWSNIPKTLSGNPKGGEVIDCMECKPAVSMPSPRLAGIPNVPNMGKTPTSKDQPEKKGEFSDDPKVFAERLSKLELQRYIKSKVIPARYNGMRNHKSLSFSATNKSDSKPLILKGSANLWQNRSSAHGNRRFCS